MTYEAEEYPDVRFKDCEILQIIDAGERAVIRIPDAGIRRIANAGISPDSEIYWGSKGMQSEGAKQPGTLILHGWYARKVGLSDE